MKKPLFFCMGLLVISIIPIIFAGVVRTPFSPRPVFHMGVTEHTVLLTFNVLWEAEEELEAVLSYLKSRESEAIFFVTGEWIKRFPEAAANILQHGQHLGNRSVSHRRLTLLAEEEITEEIKGFNRISEEILNYTSAFFRPPYGEYNGLVLRLAGDAECITLLWSINARTFTKPEPAFIVNHLEERLHPGAIILFHLSPGVSDVLPLLADLLSWKGYTIVSPKQLLR